jgi:hypothetical protein
MAEFVQGPVSRAVWPWPSGSGGASTSPRRPSALRVLAQSCIPLAVGLFLILRTSHRAGGVAAIGIGLVVLVAGLWVPRAFAALESGMAHFGRWVGVGMTWALLAPLFYLVFAPVRAVLALRRRDPMRREFPSPESTCWTERSGRAASASYGKQF